MSIKMKNTDSAYVLPRIDDWDGGRQAEILRMFLAALNLPQINFHGLRASWATIMLSKGVEAVKVMKMGGWKDLKTLNNHYVRLSGVDIKGVTDKLNLHNPSTESAEVISILQKKGARMRPQGDGSSEQRGACKIPQAVVGFYGVPYVSLVRAGQRSQVQ